MERRSASGACRSRVLGGAIRVSTPFLFVSLGECITERSGRINLGLEGMLVIGRDGRLRRVVPTAAARGSACWPPAARARCSGCCTALLCNLPRVNDIAVGIALMLLRHRARVLSRQALHPAEGADAAGRFRSASGATTPQVRCRARR